MAHDPIRNQPSRRRHVVGTSTRRHASEPVAIPSNEAVCQLRNRPGCPGSIDPDEWRKPSRAAEPRQRRDPCPPSEGLPFDEDQHLAGRHSVLERFEPDGARGVESGEYLNRLDTHGTCRVVSSRYISHAASALSGNVRGVDVDSGALVARTQDGGAVWTALRTRTQRAVFLGDRITQRLPDRALLRSVPRNGFRVAVHGWPVPGRERRSHSADQKCVLMAYDRSDRPSGVGF